VQGEDALDPNAVGHFTDGKCPPRPAPLDGNNDALKRLHPFPIPLDNADLDPHGVSRAKFREILLHEGFFKMR
jgi:hypothetical protein